MKAAISMLCLSLIAGVAFAAIGPIANTTAQVPQIMPEAQGGSCAPFLGQCSTLTFGTCDCDVPVVVGTCTGFNGRNFFVSDCGHPVDYCAIVGHCAS